MFRFKKRVAILLLMNISQQELVQALRVSLQKGESVEALRKTAIERGIKGYVFDNALWKAKEAERILERPNKCFSCACFIPVQTKRD